MARAEPLGHPRERLRRELDAYDATMLVVSSVVGVGIFLTPGVVAAQVPSPSLFLLAWLVGGLLSAAGALANAELGAMFPRAGGDYVYVREAFHPAAGFLVGWLSFFVVYAGTVATLAAGFATGLERFVSLEPRGEAAAAIGLILATSWVNARGVRSGARLNNGTAAIKLAGLAALALVAWAIPAPPHAHASAASAPTGSAALAFGLALSPVLFTYLGWNAPVYVAGEIRDPGRTIPRSLLAGLALCTALYLLLNAAYLHALSLPGMAGRVRVAEAAARALSGELGGSIAAALILVSIVGCLNATILVGPRIAYAMAVDHLFFRAVERVHDRTRTPNVAIWLQAGVGCGLVAALRRFPSLLDYTTFAILLAAMASTSALYVLRRRRAELPRPYHAWGYPLVPAAYLAANGAIALAMLVGRPKECLAALAITASGLPFLFLFARRGRSAARGG